MCIRSSRKPGTKLGLAVTSQFAAQRWGVRQRQMSTHVQRPLRGNSRTVPRVPGTRRCPALKSGSQLSIPMASRRRRRVSRVPSQLPVGPRRPPVPEEEPAECGTGAVLPLVTRFGSTCSADLAPLNRCVRLLPVSPSFPGSAVSPARGQGHGPSRGPSASPAGAGGRPGDASQGGPCWGRRRVCGH